MDSPKSLKRNRQQAFSLQSSVGKEEANSEGLEAESGAEADDSTEDDDDGAPQPRKILVVENSKAINLNKETEIKEEQIDQLENPVHSEIVQLITARSGTLQKNMIVLTDGAPFYVRCCFKHIWISNLITIRHHWCPKCDVLLEKARKDAEDNQCELLSKFYGPSLTYRCKLGHTWCQELKKYNKKGCQICKKTMKEQIKKQQEYEEQKRIEELKIKQSKLFEEAKYNYVSEECKTGYVEEEKKNEESKNKVVAAFKRMEQDVEKLILKSFGNLQDSFKSLGSSESSKNSLSSKGDIGFELEKQIRDAVSVKKIMMMPEEAIKLYLKNLPKDQQKNEYYTRAKQIHPDKNSDPGSAMAFVKLKNIFEGVAKEIY